MRRVRTLGIVCVALMIGCSSEGGPVGTGVSGSSVSGNVVSVTTTPLGGAATAAAEVADIEVSIDEVPDLTTATDDSGNFQLTGNFAGALTLHFITAQYEVRQPFDMPANSAVVLADIVLHPDAVHVEATRQLDFRAHVDLVDCAAGELLVHDNRDDDNQYMVRLTADTTIVDAAGTARACSDIHRDDVLGVEGVVRTGGDRTILAVRIVLAPRSAPGPSPVSAVHFVGSVLTIDCGIGQIEIDDGEGEGSSLLQLSRSTVIVDANRQPLRCQALSVGDRVAGNGTIQLRRPGVIEVQMLARRRGMHEQASPES